MCFHCLPSLKICLTLRCAPGGHCLSVVVLPLPFLAKSLWSVLRYDRRAHGLAVVQQAVAQIRALSLQQYRDELQIARDTAAHHDKSSSRQPTDTAAGEGAGTAELSADDIMELFRCGTAFVFRVATVAKRLPLPWVSTAAVVKTAPLSFVSVGKTSHLPCVFPLPSWARTVPLHCVFPLRP